MNLYLWSGALEQATGAETPAAVSDLSLTGHPSLRNFTRWVWEMVLGKEQPLYPEREVLLLPLPVTRLRRLAGMW